MKTCFNDKNVNVSAWPANSSDLNSTENLLSVLVRGACANSRQFSNVEELKIELIRCWIATDEEVLHRLARSISERCAIAFGIHGFKIKYWSVISIAKTAFLSSLKWFIDFRLQFQHTSVSLEVGLVEKVLRSDVACLYTVASLTLLSTNTRTFEEV